MPVIAQLKWSEAPMRYGDDAGSQDPEEPEDFRTSLGDGAQLSGAGHVSSGPGAPGNSGFVHRAQRNRAWSGPLPSPDILGEYERQMPGAAERILAFAMRLTTAMISVSAIFFSLAVARVGSTSAAMVGGSVFLSVPVIMLFRAFITRR
jgi:Predicted membrane protein (DUF2335)